MNRLLLAILPCLIAASLCGQKYNFVNWTVEDGLIQSQASYICQDNHRQLWIGTEGGICKFDGKKFTGYSVQEGLVTNHINLMLCDRAGNLWVGTNYGISVFNGKRFITIKPGPPGINNVSAFCELPDSSILALNNFKAYRIRHFKPEKISISGDTSERVTTVSRCADGSILACVHGKGIYASAGKRFSLLCAETDEKAFVSSIMVGSHGDTLLIRNASLWLLRNKAMQPYGGPLNGIPHANILSMAEDSRGRLWLASDNGAYKLEGGTLLHFDNKNGLTGNLVNHIYRDLENNLWFATDADGIYKFRENTFTYFDKSSGLSNPIVMGVTQTSDGTIYAGGYGGGLYQVSPGGELEPVSDKGPVLTDSRIYCLYADNEDNVWIGTINRGVWKYNRRTGLSRLAAANSQLPELRGATCIYKDRRGNLVIGSNQGLFVKNAKDEMTRVKNMDNGVTTAIIPFDADSLLVASSKGLYFLNSRYEARPAAKKDFANAYILCLARQNGNIWIGTPDNGVLNWNYKTGQIIKYTTAQGLPSNFIYSIYISPDQKAWIGTGFGISNLQLNPGQEVVAIKNYGRSDGLLGMECSHNCLLRAADSSLWFGTTKGLFHFNPAAGIAEKNAPFVLLRSVKLFSSDIRDSSLYSGSETWFKVPRGLKLGPKQNHVTFELGAIYFTNPEDVLYKYKLEGIDKVYTTSNNPVIIYPALPPGKYTLKVTGLTKNGLASLNQVEYTFEIEKAFYQTRFFQFMVVLLLLATGGLIAYVLTRGRQKRKQRAKELLQKIREEEFMKLRQRTAEDFHDEMGNSLTRISVLTDVLKSKLNGQQTEVARLVQQIKENTASLYNGSKDIIWSLNAQNDGLYEVTEHIKDIGMELFNETPIDFNYQHNVDRSNSLKLKLDYSRNLTMIFKEAYSNILKYARATKVDVTVTLTAGGDLRIDLRDDGTGFSMAEAQAGNGLKNMENRAKRMNGSLKIETAPGRGTHIAIYLTTIFT